jgi:hypothetical protein
MRRETELARQRAAQNGTSVDTGSDANELQQAVEQQPELQQAEQVPVAKIGREQILELTRIYAEYKAGKAHLDSRIISAENWWRLRNETEADKLDGGNRQGFRSKSGWLHNVIVSKHADAMDSYPEPCILPREQGDQQEARMLSSIIPCVLEQNHFETTYSTAMWTKIKSGTGIYKVIWDKSKLNGLGDIGIEPVSVLNLAWEPGITDIQKSRYLFHAELVDKDLLAQQYPELDMHHLSEVVTSRRYDTDDQQKTDGKCTVIDCYYHTYDNGNVLQYVKFVGDQVLYATENDPETAQKGLYDHGLFPYVFDPLFPVEGSPCGYGFVDLCKQPQLEIDKMKTAIVRNTMAGAVPRFFARHDASVNVEDFLDLDKTIVRTDGQLGEDALRQINVTPIDDAYIAYLNNTIQELRETSGNTETSTGSASSGVTAASAIAALQEASGKGSKDSTRASYRAFSKIVELCVELIRQFYDMPRKFRIVGQYGQVNFTTYTNQGLQPQYQGSDFGQDMGYRTPVFDIKVSAQKQSAYTTLSNNELALQLFQLGFFNPQLTDQALPCLEMMEFDGKDEVLQKVSQNGTMQQRLIQYQQMALALAQKYEPALVAGLASDITGDPSLSASAPVAGGSTNITEQDSISGLQKDEIAQVSNAREKSQEASQPDGGRVIAERDKK